MNAQDEVRVQLILHYDGSNFFGWQVQRHGRTVQGELQAALERLTREPRAVIGAGRTDRGVHASGQVAAVTVPERWSVASLRSALNAVLPEDIWVAGAREVPLAFHPRYDATHRTYEYRVGLEDVARSPFHRRWCWPVVDAVDPELLHEGAMLLPGEKSFRAFAKSGQPERGELCTVVSAEWTEWEALGLRFRITANRYLHHMVRYLVGTMVDVARGWRPLDELRALLDGGPHEFETSPPAPPEGLFLAEVGYPPEALAIEPARPHANEGISDT